MYRNIGSIRIRIFMHVWICIIIYIYTLYICIDIHVYTCVYIHIRKRKLSRTSLRRPDEGIPDPYQDGPLDRLIPYQDPNEMSVYKGCQDANQGI